MYSKHQLALTEKDIDHLKGSITVGLAFSLLFFTIGLLLGVLYQLFIFFGWQFPVYEKLWIGVAALIGYAELFIVIFLSFFLYKTILERIDLISGKKTQYNTDSYKIIEKKSNLYIKLSSPVKKRIDLLDNRLVEMIDPTKPLTVEVTKYSKTVLFISNDTDNLIEKLDAIDELEDAVFENGK